MNNVAQRVSGETFFFRDHGQFDLLRLRLLPELIEHRSGAKKLRLWSAGCASGEEAYSLAMLLDMLLPERNGWDIHILGSDINQTALAKAQRGRYGRWSFRMAPPMLQQRYFRRTGDEWMLNENILSMVTFSTVDLIRDPFPNEELCNMDLILCRNVFIYFDADAIAAVAEKQAATLREGGYLLTGHTELIGHRIRNLQSKLFAEGVVYQRTTPLSTEEIPPPSFIVDRPTPSTVPSPQVPVQTFHSQPAVNIKAMLAEARKHADLGKYEQAEQACRQVLTVVPLAAQAHFLLAQLAQLKGDFMQAGELLEKTIYLDSRYVAAYLELAALCERNKKLPRAQTLRRAALDIVRTLPGDTVIEPYEMTAAEMAQWNEHEIA